MNQDRLIGDEASRNAPASPTWANANASPAECVVDGRGGDAELPAEATERPAGLVELSCLWYILGSEAELVDRYTLTAEDLGHGDTVDAEDGRQLVGAGAVLVALDQVVGLVGREAELRLLAGRTASGRSTLGRASSDLRWSVR